MEEQKLLKTENIKIKKPRYYLLDTLRGFMVFCMVFFHGFISAGMVFENSSVLNFFDFLYKFFSPAEPFFAGGFIILSGICCHFSRSNLKRGIILFIIALIINIFTVTATAFFDMEISIYFGILNLLSFCMIFVGIFNFILKRINGIVGIIVTFIAFLALYYFVAKPDYSFTLTQNPYVFMFGFVTKDFYSTDYFPILPWAFLYLTGYFIGKTNIIQKHEKIFCKKIIPPFAFIGKYALIIYVLHQPIIYGLCYLINFAVNK